MGKTQIPRYIIQDDKGQFLGAWMPAKEGRPNVQNLIKWRDGFNLSLCRGGANEHIGQNGWIQRRIHIFDQYTRRKVVEYNPPLFECMPTHDEAATERARAKLYSISPAELKPRALEAKILQTQN